MYAVISSIGKVYYKTNTEVHTMPVYFSPQLSPGSGRGRPGHASPPDTHPCWPQGQGAPAWWASASACVAGWKNYGQCTSWMIKVLQLHELAKYYYSLSSSVDFTFCDISLLKRWNKSMQSCNLWAGSLFLLILLYNYITNNNIKLLTGYHLYFWQTPLVVAMEGEPYNYNIQDIDIIKY